MFVKILLNTDFSKFQYSLVSSLNQGVRHLFCFPHVVFVSNAASVNFVFNLFRLSSRSFLSNSDTCSDFCV
jgi:hypothetical protein